MARSLLDLAESLERRAGAYGKEGSKLAVKVAVTVVTDLAYETPVDTTQALSNWQVALGSPVNKAIDPYFPGDFGDTQPASAAATIAAAKQILKGKKPGQTIFISNVVDYIGDLNDGSSKQTPAGFVERAALLGRKQVRKAKLKV